MSSQILSTLPDRNVELSIKAKKVIAMVFKRGMPYLRPLSVQSIKQIEHGTFIAYSQQTDPILKDFLLLHHEFFLKVLLAKRTQEFQTIIDKKIHKYNHIRNGAWWEKIIGCLRYVFCPKPTIERTELDQIKNLRENLQNFSDLQDYEQKKALPTYQPKHLPQEQTFRRDNYCLKNLIAEYTAFQTAHGQISYKSE